MEADSELALKGRRFETATELEEAPWAALVYWSERCHPHIWKKRPQEQMLLKYTLLSGYGVSFDAHP